MLTNKEILLYLRSNKDLFAKEFEVREIGLLGSFARNEQTSDSDIDILIDMDPDAKNIFEKRMALREKISKHFGRSVDVCHKKAIKPVFKELVFKDLIYT